jgi:16S rRNA G966 N2-methylase RsmD
VTVEKRAVGSFLRRAVEAQAGVRYGVVFLDPPYDAEAEYTQTLGLLGGDGARLLAEGALVIAEHRKKDALAEEFGALKRVRLLTQGDAGVSFYAVTE